MTTYRDAGVDLEKAEELVERIGWRVSGTWTEDVLGGFGGFAAGIRVPPGYVKPVLMMSTDGVGTKAELARVTGLVEGLGYDLLAMVGDDLAAVGATPIAIQDYIALGYMDLDRVEAIVTSIAEACDENDVALLGGETAEHPGILEGDRFDVAGTALGIIDMGDEIDTSTIAPDDVVIGVHSPNLRSNGFSMVRALIVDQLDLEADFPGTDQPAAEVLLQPSVIYAPAANNALARAKPHGLAHITGGGLPHNIARVLPEGTGAILERSRWEIPNVFSVIQELGSIDDQEMFRIFNMGIGFVAFAAEDDADRIVKGFKSHEHDVSIIGRIVEGDGDVEIK